MAKLSELTTGNIRKVFVMGEPGSGKTVFACGFPGPVKVFDFDSKIESAYGYYKKANPQQLEVIDYERCGPFDDRGGAYVKLDKALDEARVQFAKGERPFETLVIDSSTIMADEMLNWLVYYETGIARNSKIKSRTMASQQDYMLFAPTFSSFLHEILSLPCNLVMTGHIAIKEDEKTKEIYRQASIPGQMGKKIGVYFPEVYRSYAEGGKYWAQTKADFRYPCRTQISGLPEKIELRYEELIKQR